MTETHLRLATDFGIAAAQSTLSGNTQGITRRVDRTVGAIHKSTKEKEEEEKKKIKNKGL
jgi:hypothetical protein